MLRTAPRVRPDVIILSAVLLIAAVPLPAAPPPADQGVPRVLWYAQPARNWETEALPLGNGRLGGMVFGGTEKEQIQFNEDTLWIGDEKDTGAYQAFGDIFVELAHAGAADYRRQLDIARAVHTVTYKIASTWYKREYFSSRPAQVMVFRFTADKKGAYSGKITLTDMHKAAVTAAGNRITAKGDLSGYAYRGGSGRGTKNVYAVVLDYEAQLLVVNEGGTLKAEDGAIAFDGCDALNHDTVYWNYFTGPHDDNVAGL